MVNALWSEEYRPSKISECILPKELGDTFSKIVAQGSIPNMLLSGTSGLGKTTVARALCNELGLDYIQINSSEDSGIDVLRTKIRQFASTRSLTGGDNHKVVILDEADYLNPSSTQPALRAFIEEFSDSCRFIFTCNFKNRMLDALQSRCTCIDFSFNKKQLVGLSAKFHKRLKGILDEKEITYDDKVLAHLVMRYAPDWRRLLNECQRYALNGEVSTEILSSLSDDNVNLLFKYLKEKNFKEMRKWVALNSDIDASTIIRLVYDHISTYAEPPSVPSAILILADYQYKSAFVADQELNMVACMTEIMRDVKFK